MELTREQLVAWAAGFFDGEGSVIITRRYGQKHDTPHVRMNVDQKVREPLERLVLLFGGSIQKYKRRSLKHADIFHWYAVGKRAGAILEELRPYLIVKAGQAEIALEFISGVGGQGNSGRAFLSSEEEERRDALREAILILNKRGPR